jgi:hypothetical protein
MAVSAGKVKGGNGGQTDKMRGNTAKMPAVSVPNGRALSSKGKLASAPNDNSPAGLHRKSSGGAIYGG